MALIFGPLYLSVPPFQSHSFSFNFWVITCDTTGIATRKTSGVVLTIKLLQGFAFLMRELSLLPILLLQTFVLSLSV